jgi:hypothetical protein
MQHCIAQFRSRHGGNRRERVRVIIVITGVMTWPVEADLDV